MLTDPATPRPLYEFSMAKRAGLAVAGLVVLLIGVVVTLGVVLIPIASILVAWYLARRRDGQLTRGRAWVIGVLAAAIPLAVAFGIAVIAAPRETPAERRASEAQAARSRESMPDWLKRVSPAQQPGAPAADSIANRLMDNSVFMIWIGAMGTVIGASFLGCFVGTIGWGSTMLLFGAVRGDWIGNSASFPLR
jgi:hypothetical protein